MTRTKLTARDILNMEGDGWGYLGHNIRSPGAWKKHASPYSVPWMLDRALARRANRLQITREQLYAYLNSREARHDSDAAISLKDADSACDHMAASLEDFARRWLNREDETK